MRMDCDNKDDYSMLYYKICHNMILMQFHPIQFNSV